MIFLNKYQVKSGTSLEFWESKGWIHPIDPYGWVQWYCNFFSGRRCEDDERQIKRWCNFAGPKGRFRRQLISKIIRNNSNFDDFSMGKSSFGDLSMENRHLDDFAMEKSSF